MEYDEVIRSYDFALAPVLENGDQATTFGDLRHGKARIDQLKEGWHQIITDDGDAGEGVRFDSGAADNERNADASFEHKAFAVGQESVGLTSRSENFRLRVKISMILRSLLVNKRRKSREIWAEVWNLQPRGVSPTDSQGQALPLGDAVKSVDGLIVAVVCCVDDVGVVFNAQLFDCVHDLTNTCIKVFVHTGKDRIGVTFSGRHRLIPGQHGRAGFEPQVVRVVRDL